MQPEGDAMADAARISLPDKAVVRGAGPKPRLRADQRQNRRLWSADTKVKPSHAVGDRRAEHLVDHDPPLRVGMLDGEDRAARQQADRDPGAIGDLHEAKIVPPWRRQNLCGRVGHSLSLERFYQSDNANSLFIQLLTPSLSELKTRRGRLICFGARPVDRPVKRSSRLRENSAIIRPARFRTRLGRPNCASAPLRA